MQVQVELDAAARKLSALIAAAERGDDVVIVRDGVPAVRLVPCRAGLGMMLGSVSGQIALGDEFDAPLSEFAPYELSASRHRDRVAASVGFTATGATGCGSRRCRPAEGAP